MPVTSTLSPGFTASNSSSCANSVTHCGVSPSGTWSGTSCIFTSCLSTKYPLLWSITIDPGVWQLEQRSGFSTR